MTLRVFDGSRRRRQGGGSCKLASWLDWWSSDGELLGKGGNGEPAARTEAATAALSPEEWQGRWKQNRGRGGTWDEAVGGLIETAAATAELLGLGRRVVTHGGDRLGGWRVGQQLLGQGGRKSAGQEMEQGRRARNRGRKLGAAWP